jgi:hypothetical protein
MPDYPVTCFAINGLSGHAAVIGGIISHGKGRAEFFAKLPAAAQPA